MAESARDGSLLILVTNDGMGRSEQALQHKLIGTYLQLLDENGMLPGAIAFYTDGVKLACKSSPVVPSLKLIQGMGVRLVLCKSCLDYFGLLEDVAVGDVGGMNDILKLLMEADHVITA